MLSRIPVLLLVIVLPFQASFPPSWQDRARAGYACHKLWGGGERGFDLTFRSSPSKAGASTLDADPRGCSCGRGAFTSASGRCLRASWRPTWPFGSKWSWTPRPCPGNPCGRTTRTVLRRLRRWQARLCARMCLAGSVDFCLCAREDQRWSAADLDCSGCVAAADIENWCRGAVHLQPASGDGRRRSPFRTQARARRWSAIDLACSGCVALLTWRRLLAPVGCLVVTGEVNACTGNTAVAE